MFKVTRPRVFRIKSINTPLLALLSLLAVMLAAQLNDLPAPKIDTQFEGATIHISADRGWSLTPFDCIELRWQLEGIESVYIDNVGKIGWGEMIYCPPWDGTGPEFRITAQNGAVDTFSVKLNFGPDVLLVCLLFAVVLTLGGLAGHYLMRPSMDKRVPATWSAALLFAIATVACLLVSASTIFSVRQFLLYLGQLFASPAWHLFGAGLAACIFIPIMIQKLRAGITTKAIGDFAAIAAFLLILLLFYLPFGFEYIDLYENWVFQAYLEGRPSRTSTEIASRFWMMVPVTLAQMVKSDSFAGFHIVHLLMFFGKMALLYGLLRHLRIPPYIGFLCTVLFFIYPVNSDLMMLRTIPHTFSSLALLVATYLALTYRANPSRLQLLGI